MTSFELPVSTCADSPYGAIHLCASVWLLLPTCVPVFFAYLSPKDLKDGKMTYTMVFTLHQPHFLNSALEDSQARLSILCITYSFMFTGLHDNNKIFSHPFQETIYTYILQFRYIRGKTAHKIGNLKSLSNFIIAININIQFVFHTGCCLTNFANHSLIIVI